MPTGAQMMAGAAEAMEIPIDKYAVERNPDSMSIYEYKPFLYFMVAVAAAVGAVMGSFLNCAAWRIAHNESFLKGRSHCPTCGHVLGPLELIPVLSWVIQRGRCHSCGEKISIRYPLTELVYGLITVLCLLRFDFTVLCLRNYIFLCCLFCLSLVDLESFIIPDECHIISVAAWVIALPFTFTGTKDTVLHILAGIVFGGGILLISIILDKILGRESLGGGDVKLLAVSGLYLGMAGTLFALIFACIFGLILYMTRRGKEGTGKEFPFGPSISMGVALMLLFGEPLVQWYLGLLGI